MPRSAPLERRPRGKPRGGLPLQAKLAVGPARDRYEAEADRVAEHVQRAVPGTAPPAISRLPASAAQRAPAASPPKVEDLEDKVETTKVEDEEDKSTAVQRSPDGPAAAPASAEAAIGRMRAAGGARLGPAVLSRMETGFGRALGHVRVHDGVPAAQAARDVGARAFTVGNDIFFGAGQYRPETATGQHLLAHELTHTEQQKGLTGAAQRMPLQRDATDPNPRPQTRSAPLSANGEQQVSDEPGTTFATTGARGIRIVLSEDGQGGTLYLPTLPIPRVQGGYKGASNHPKAPGVPDTEHGKAPITPGTPYVYRGSTTRETAASQEFQKQKYFQSSEDNLEPVLLGKLPSDVRNWHGAPDIRNEQGEQRRYLRLRSVPANSTTTIIFGTTEELADHKRIKLPNWERNGAPARFDVDHSQELQLGGLDGWANFWLLDSTANQSSGREIANRLQTDIEAAIQLAQDGNFWRGANAPRKPTFESFKTGASRWEVEFAGIRNVQIDNANGPYWTNAEILAGLHLRHLVAMSESELLQQGLILRGDRPAAVSVFTSMTGGFRRRFSVNRDGAVTPDRERGGDPNQLFGGFTYQSVETNPTPATAPYITRIHGEVFRRRRGQIINPATLTGGIPVNAGEGLGFSGYLDNATLQAAIRAIRPEITNASPVTFTEAGIDVDGNIFASGMITATKALFPGLQIPIVIRGNDIFIEFPIPTESLSFGPLRVTEAALMVGVGENGVFLSGAAGLELAQIGRGRVEARVERGNTILTGTFDFDLDFLDPAQASVTYDYNRDLLTVALTAGVQRGRLPGIESGQVTVSISRESASVSGELRPAGALAGTVVTIGYTTEGGLVVGADNIPLPVENIPGVNSATASLHARRDPTTGEWSFGGAGAAELGIVGATGSVSISVDGPKVTFGGNLNVAHGPASGSISFTATNAPMDEGGNIIDGPPTATFTVFGRGRAEITFGRILHGSAEIELSPDASITIRGAIGLPPTFEVFPRSEYNKTLFTIETPDFPIWGVSVAGVGIGIFGFADASLSFNAFVGPGQLGDTQVTAEMDLDHPEDATITGSATFAVPAYAGLKLDIGGGLRARVAVAYVEGRVGLDAELGIAAEASAGVDIVWNRNDGLSVAAEIEADAQPKFRVGVNASVTVGVDLWLTEIEKTWGPWRRTLGEFGPEMGLGITVPVEWSEQNGLGFSTDDIQIRYPQISVVDILKSSFEELV